MIIERYLTADRELVTVVLCQQIYHSNEGYRRTTEMDSAPSKCTKKTGVLKEILEHSNIISFADNFFALE